MSKKKIDNSISTAVKQSLETYFKELDGEPPQHLYDLVMQQVEQPLLELVLEKTADNKSKAAEMLGLNRGTLRKKLKQYNLI